MLVNAFKNYETLHKRDNIAEFSNDSKKFI